MLGVTADTNIYVSALHFGGKPRQFLDAARHGRFELHISEAILAELLRVLRDDFAWESAALDDTAQRLRSFCKTVTPTATLAVVQADPDDNRILECAEAAGSHFIISGDNHLLRLGSYGSIPIMKVADFLDMLDPS